MSTEKTRLELRFEPDIAEGLKQLADDADISVNQLLQALSRWAIDNGHAGEAVHDEKGMVRTKDQPGCIWFGKEAFRLTPKDAEYHHVQEHERASKGRHIFTLDFTVRRVVRDQGHDSDS